MKPVYLWAPALLVYLVFCAWYTNLSGPLTETEIEKNLQAIRDNGADPERVALLEAFMRSDTGNDFIMINLLDRNENPPTLPETGAGASADDLIDHYMEHMYPAQLARASHPVFFGNAVSDALDLTGIEGGAHWEQGALFRYRSRRDVMEIALDPRFTARHDYKLGALTKTIAFPVEPQLHPGDLRLQLALLLTALTALLHLLLVRDRS